MKEIKEIIETKIFLIKCLLLELTFKKRTKKNTKRLFKKKYKKIKKVLKKYW